MPASWIASTSSMRQAFLGPDAVPVVAPALIEKPAINDFALHRFGEDFAYEGWLNDPWHS